MVSWPTSGASSAIRTRTAGAPPDSGHACYITSRTPGYCDSASSSSPMSGRGGDSMDSARERVLRFELEPRIRHRTPGTRVATCQGGCPPRRRSRSSHESAHRLLVGFGIACHAPGRLLAIRARATNPPPDSRNPKIELKLSTYATSPHAHLGIAIRPLRPARCLAGVATTWTRPGSVCCDSSSNHESATGLPERV